MKYNLAEQTYVVSNTILGNVELNGSQVNGLLIDPSTDVVTLSGVNDDILVIDCDLNYRTAVEQLRYYFSSATASGTLVNTIGFQYKDDTTDAYSALTTQIGNGYYYATITSGLSAPRYIRLTHTLSGTSITGNVQSFYVVNDDEEIDFGVDGNATQKNILSSVAVSTVVPVEIFNDSADIATMYAMIEATNEDVDDLLGVSSSESGPFYGPVLNAENIADSTSWETGTLNNTIINNDDKLVIFGGVTASQFDPNQTSSTAILTNNGYTVEGTLPAPSLMYSMSRSIAGFNYGKWYWEMELTTFASQYVEFGLADESLLVRDVLRTGQLKDLPIGGTGGLVDGPALGWSVDSFGYKIYDAWTTNWLGGIGQGYIVRFALDLDEGKIWFGVNDSAWPNNADPAAGTFAAFDNIPIGPTYRIYAAAYETSSSVSISSTILYTNRIPEGFNAPFALLDEGTYTTRISDDTSELRRYHIKATTPDDSMITTVSGSYYETVEVRESPTKPLNYSYYTKLDFPGQPDQYTKLYDYWNYDQSLKEISEDIGYNYLYDTYTPDSKKYLFTDNKLELKVGGYSFDPTGNNITSSYNIFRYPAGGPVTVFTLNTGGTYRAAPVTNIYFMETDSLGGMWVYFYSEYYASGSFVTTTGYYLTYFDNTMTNKIKLINSSNFYGEILAVDYNRNELWYCDSATSLINRMDISGDIVFSYFENTNDVKDIMSDRNRGLWYINGTTLYHINYIGDVLSSIDFSYTKLAYRDTTTVWGLATNRVDNVYLDTGEAKFSIQVMFAQSLHPVSDGLYVRTSDNKLVYIDYESREIKFTLTDVFYNFGFMDAPLEEPNFEAEFPIVVDSVWNNLDWKEVNYYKYILDSNSIYQQLRLTLRPDSTKLKSPIVDSIYLQKAIKVQGIQPQYYKDIYVKIENPTENDIGIYSPKLLVWKEDLT